MTMIQSWAQEHTNTFVAVVSAIAGWTGVSVFNWFMRRRERTDWINVGDHKYVVMVLHNLAFGGEFAHWMRTKAPPMPLAAVREYDEAVRVMEHIVGSKAETCEESKAETLDETETAAALLSRFIDLAVNDAPQHELDGMLALHHLNEDFVRKAKMAMAILKDRPTTEILEIAAEAEQ